MISSGFQSLTIHNGWLALTQGVTHCPSPNYDVRQSDISLLVIHHISLPPGEFRGKVSGEPIADLFCNRLDSTADPFYQQIADLRVSAHCLIKRNGAIVQFVNFNDRAWHAGQSVYQGRTGCNDFSIGIELEGTGELPYRYGQYVALQMLTVALLKHYPLIATHIAGHEHIAPGRKTDPGPSFDWVRYLSPLGIALPKEVDYDS